MANKPKLQLPDFFKYLLIACGIVAVIVAIVYWGNRGSQVRLEARVLKARVIPTDDAASLAVLEVRIHNPANVLFVIREAHLKAVLADGNEIDGAPVTQGDLDRYLDYYKTYGARYNPVLRTKEKVFGGALTDRTIAASFPRAAADIDKRRGFVLEVADVDGAVTRITDLETAAK